MRREELRGMGKRGWGRGGGEEDKGKRDNGLKKMMRDTVQI